MKKVNCILLVDDNPADNEFHIIQLKKAGVCNHIQVVTDGDKALSYIKKSGESDQPDQYPKPDLIFLDINMPRMNGFEFLEEYQKFDEELKSRGVIVMLTTSLNPDDLNTAMTIKEIRHFKNKPLTVTAIQEIIDKFF